MASRLVVLAAVAVLFSASSVALALALPGQTGPGPDLIGVVGPSDQISLYRADNTAIGRLAPGTYTIRVDDRSDLHNFHLSGPDVDRSTDVDLLGSQTWTVTFRDGRYEYSCDPHAAYMRGAFTVGAPSTAPKPPAAPTRTRLTATVGPGSTIALTAGGRIARTLKPGPYAVVVRDRSARHNVHLIGPGVNRKTTARYRGTVTWNLTLRPGTHRVTSDADRRRLTRTFRVVR